MGDADIIPIGTRGRPGRGTGTRPSSAARSLAPRGASRSSADEQRPTPSDGASEGAASAPGGGSDEERRTTPPPAEPTTSETAPPEESSAVLPDSGSTAPEPRPSILERGLPSMSDLMGALQHAAREVFGDQWEPQLAHFLAFLRRRVTGSYEVDEFGFDPEVTERFFTAALRPLAEKWFRIEVRGIENIPATGGALVVSNHSGTLPMDALMTTVTIRDHADRFLRPLGADLVFRLPLVGSMARKGGATLACGEDAERMLRNGELVGVWPEGFKGIGKSFSDRYKLQRFGRGGFVSAAIRTGVPIIPVSVVGAEEIYPLVGNIPTLARLLGVPYIPITPFFPLLGPLGLVPLPSKWLIEFGEPIRTDEYEEGAADDPMLVFDVTDQVRETIQQTLYSLLVQREGVFR